MDSNENMKPFGIHEEGVESGLGASMDMNDPTLYQ